MKKRFHLTIGISYVPAMVAVLLKKIGLTNHAIYYCYDYVQSLKESSLFKRIVATAFYILDSRIVKWSDLTWNLTEPIGTVREELAHRHGHACLRQFTVRRPLFQKVGITPKLNSNTAVYMGYLRSNQGAEQIIEAVPLILKHIPDFRLLMIGSGPEEGRLRELAMSIGVGDQVIFHGYVQAGARLIDLLSSASLGLAIYAPSSISGLRWYIDPSKVRTYIQYYIPVVTNVSPIMLGRLKESNAIIRILDDKDALSQTVVKLLRNRQLLYKMQASINDLIDDYRAEHIFDDAFAKSARVL